jgi:hypothetical protein
MTSVEIHFHYAMPPAETVLSALAKSRDVYGIHRLTFNYAARTLHIEYDATRLNAATVAKLVRMAGLEIVTDLPFIPAQPPLSQVPAA